MPAPVFFLSDFGGEDAFVGIVEAVILGIAPHARVVHLGHGIPPQDLRRAAYQLYQTVPYLPDDAVVLVVVDPGVGSRRRAVVAETDGPRFVAPDNGVLDLAFLRAPARAMYALDSPAHRLPTTSRTFDGRDVFGPAAAHLAAGASPAELGTPLDPDGRVRLGVELTERDDGEVLTFDRFGNAITTLRADRETAWRAAVVGHRTVPRGDHYAAVERGAPVALAGSAGLVELSVRDGDARATLGLAPGTSVRLV